MKNYLMGFMSLYFIMSLFFGYGAAKNIPYINTVGIIYYSAVWPAWPISTIIGIDIMPIPNWVFTDE